MRLQFTKEVATTIPLRQGNLEEDGHEQVIFGRDKSFSFALHGIEVASCSQHDWIDAQWYVVPNRLNLNIALGTEAALSVIAELSRMNRAFRNEQKLRNRLWDMFEPYKSDKKTMNEKVLQEIDNTKYLADELESQIQEFQVEVNKLETEKSKLEIKITELFKELK